MKGETELDSLIRNMNPKHVPGEFVFCTVDSLDEKQTKSAILFFREKEGVTIVMPRDTAEAMNLRFESIWGLITLSVFSDLEAVGFLAKITSWLAQAGISVNVVSAYYHDHLFVPYSRVHDALQILEEIPESITR